MNWRGRPLTSHQVIVDLTGGTTTRTGLKVHAELDNGTYPSGIKISDAQMAALPITRHVTSTATGTTPSDPPIRRNRVLFTGKP
jgi:Rhodopirellula transposase DDE domain